MSLRDYLHLLRQGRWWITGGLLVGLLGSGVLLFLSTPIYTASATLYVAANEGAGEAGQAYQGSQLAAQKATVYAQLLGTDRIRAEVAAKLRSPIAAGAISGAAQAGNPVLIAQGIDPVPERAQELANAATLSITDLVAELEDPLDPNPKGYPLINIRVVQPAALPMSPTSPRPIVNLVVGAILGALIGGAVSAMMTTLATPGEVSEARDRPGHLA